MFEAGNTQILALCALNRWKFNIWGEKFQIWQPFRPLNTYEQILQQTPLVLCSQTNIMKKLQVQIRTREYSTCLKLQI